MFSFKLVTKFSNIGAELFAVTLILTPGKIPPQLISCESQNASSESVTRIAMMKPDEKEVRI